MIKCFGDWGYGLTFSSIQSIISEYLLQTGQQMLFVNGIPGRDWWYGFLNRWKSDLSLRKAENIASLRASSCTQKIINKYFENCRKTFNEERIDLTKASFVWNCDETGFSGDQGKIEILCRRGSKRPLRLTGNNEKINYTVHNCCNASGYYMPPFIVYKSKGRLYDKWMQGGPNNVVYTTSPSGGMEKDNIVLICLPAHSSHILQPLDVGVYCHVKKVWRKILTSYYASNGYKNLDRENFAPCLKLLLESGEAFTTVHAVSGFLNTGFFPLNQDKVDKNKLKIAETFNLMESSTANTSPVPTASTSLVTSAYSTSPTSPTATTSTTISTVSITRTPENYSKFLEKVGKSLEASMKSFFQIKNETTFIRKSKKTNLRKFDAEVLTNSDVMERIKQKEEEAKSKKNAKRRLDLEDEDEVDNDNEPSETAPIPKKIKTQKCKRCRAPFHSEMLACENKKCCSWLCNPLCLPKRFLIGTDFYCSKKCKEDVNKE